MEIGKDYSINELIACALSRDVEDGESVQCGANAVVQRATYLLAHLHHGPNMRILIGRTFTNLFDTPVLELYDSNTDWRAARWGEYIIPHDESFSYNTNRAVNNFAIGAMQIDQYGNTNMIGIKGDDGEKYKVRGPGGVGTTCVSAVKTKFYIIMNNHEKRHFVDKLDYVSGIGYGSGPETRKKLGLTGNGPTLVASPLGIFDFEEDTKKMRIKSLHPGVKVEDVIGNTGFEMVIPSKIEVTPEPTEDELYILRNRIDPEGVLRR